MTGPRSAPHQRLGAAAATLVVLGVAACENPRPPAACGPLPQVTVHAGEQASVTGCFNDPNGEVLTYSVSSANPGVAAVSLAGTTVIVDAVAPGNTFVTITASDPGGLQGQQGFQVMVPNRPPVPRGTIPPITVRVGQTESVDVSSYFAEPDGEALTYGAASSSPAVATVSAAGSTVTVTAVAKGTTIVRVTATDPGALSATQEFLVTVPNRAPEPVGTIADETVEVGGAVAVDLSAYFADPDGDGLGYAAMSSNASVAGVSVSGSAVTVTAVAKGTANVTITATDTEGLSATQVFEVTVPNRAPEPVGTIADETVEVGAAVAVDLSRYFEDPDGDGLGYAAMSSNASVAGVSVSGSTVTVTAVAKGTANVTITATDTEGLSATQVFRVTVPNRAPEPVGTIPDETVEVGGAVAVDLSRYFEDPDGDGLGYAAGSSSTSVAGVSVSGSTVTVTAVAKGTANVTITATDTEGLSAVQVFQVTVPNRAPEPVGTIADETVEVGGAVAVDLSRYFEDPDGDGLGYAAMSSNASVAGVSVSGSTVTVTAVAKGTANVTITATDTEGLSAAQAFEVTVPNRAPEPVGAIRDETVEVGGAVAVDLSRYFQDPDGDGLGYAARSSNTSVAGVSVSGSTVTVTAVAKGTANVTTTATDTEGLSAVQVFRVTVPNRAPEPVGAIRDETVEVGGAVAVDLSRYFEDPDGDGLGYAAMSSNTSVAGVSVSGSTVTVTAVAKGTATVTTTATDAEGLSAAQAFEVTVPNRAPEPAGTIPGETIEVGGAVAVDLSRYFQDPDGDGLGYAARSSNTSVAGVSVSGSTVTVTAVAKGAATVTITAKDTEGLSAAQAFEVTVPNRAPEPAGTIRGETIEVGAAVAVDLSAYFEDPDGDRLAYAASSSNTSVAGVSVSGSTVTVTAVAKGTATVTTTATDTEGLSATQAFQVTVSNRAPKPVGTIPGETVEVGEAAAVNLSPYFADPDGDALTYTAISTNTSVARVSVSGSTVTVTAVAKGTATVTTTATDTEGLSATQVFQVTVPNRAPEPAGTIPGESIEVGAAVAVNLSPYFADPDGDALTYSATSSNTSVARVSVSGSTVTVTAVAKGTATVSTTATDTEGLSATQAFQVTVPNRAPRPVGTIPARTLNPGEAVAINASQHFADPDGDPLTYSATSSSTNVARVSVSGSTVTITAVAAGSATITITARDPGGLTATQRVGVTVAQPNRAPRPVGTIPAPTLNPGEAVAIDASRYFSDPDGDPLTYTATSSSTSVAGVSVSGSTVTITAVAAGSATITITARDPGGLTATQHVGVTVEDRGSFDIDLVFATEVTSGQERAFRDAARQWMAILADTELADFQVNGTISCSGEYAQSVETIDDLMIVAAVVEIDGPGGTLGQAGPCWVRNENGLPIFGRMEFDEADLEEVERRGRLKPLILHEMGHVLGIGTLWRYHNLLRNPSSQTDALDTHFVGRLAVGAFDAAGGDGYAGGEKVPVENTGGAGTRNVHWRRSVFGKELMIGWLTDSTPLSAITIQSLADLGYAVDPGLADAYRLPDEAAAALMLEDAIGLGNDIIRGPLVVADRTGRIVRIIPP